MKLLPCKWCGKEPIDGWINDVFSQRERHRSYFVACNPLAFAICSRAENKKKQRAIEAWNKVNG